VAAAAVVARKTEGHTAKEGGDGGAERVLSAAMCIRAV